MDKTINTYEEVREKILRGANTISDPIKQTLSPKGRNVLLQHDRGGFALTNDGVTIAKQIQVSDPTENAVIDIIRQASLRTNDVAGDGTSTSVVLSQLIIKEGLKLIDEGKSWVEVRDMFTHIEKSLIKGLKKQVIPIKSNSDIENIARISSNNDKEIAKNITKVNKVTGQDGMIFIEPSLNKETELVEDLGFMIKSGILYQELLKKAGTHSISYTDVPVLVTDKRIYYPEEAEGILRVIVKAGYSSVVIVARDIIGEAVNTFLTNHQEGVVNVMLVSDPLATEKSNVSLQDLSSYLGGKVISDKTGNLVDRLKIEDFILANKVFQDGNKTLITPKNSAGKELNDLIQYLRDEIKKDKKDKDSVRRLSSLTNGIVTIKVGGSTPMEVNEKIFRYEDAVNATRSAIKEGYVVGGGIGLLNAFNPKDYTNEGLKIAQKYSEAIVRQIATNCGKHPDTVLENIRKKGGNFGYNAVTDKYQDLMKANVIDPFEVLKMSVENSISVAKIIISIGYYVMNDLDALKKLKELKELREKEND